MQAIQRKLLVQFWLPVAVCLVIIVLYESDLLLPAAWHGAKIAEYYSAIVMELLTICIIPVSLRLFKFGLVRRSFASNPTAALLRWGSVRLLMLVLPMLVNTFLYYQFMNVAFGYMGIILLLCMAFVYPSRRRCDDESRQAGDEQEGEEKSQEAS